MLGAPGAFVQNADLAWSTWLGWGPKAVLEALMGGSVTPPGFADPARAARRLAGHIIALLARHRRGIHAFVTHDILLGTLVARLVGRRLYEATWPRFLDGAWLWRDADRIVVTYGKDRVDVSPRGT
jgi:hypothetical protein